MFRISHRLFYFYRTNFAVFSAVFLSSDDLIGLDLKVIFFPGFQFLPGQFCGVRLFDRLRPLPVFLLSDRVENLISRHAFDLLPLQHCFFAPGCLQGNKGNFWYGNGDILVWISRFRLYLLRFFNCHFDLCQDLRLLHAVRCDQGLSGCKCTDLSVCIHRCHLWISTAITDAARYIQIFREELYF